MKSNLEKKLMSTIASILKKGRVKRFKHQGTMENSNLDIYEQMSEFITTNGDLYILPYLNKFEKATLA